MIALADRLADVKEYYFATKLREIRTRNAAGENILNLGIGNPDLPPPSEALHRLIDSAREPAYHGYQPYKGIAELRESMADWYGRIYGVELDPLNEIQPLIGSKEGIMHISQAFLNPGDRVLVPDPGYLTYGAVAKLMGAEILNYDLTEENNWLPDLEALARQDLSDVKLMWVNYPHMPTGTASSDELFETLIAFGRENEILIVNDNPYSLVLNQLPKSILAYPGAFEVCLELNSLSKSHNMAGWRIGLVAGASAYVKAVLQVKSNMDSGMWLPLQQAAATALNMPFSWHQEQNEIYADRRGIAHKILDQLNCTVGENQVGLFLWAKIPDTAESSEGFSEMILNETKVFLTPGFIFGSNGSRYIRISLCSSSSSLEIALDRIQSFIQAGQQATALP